MCDLPILANNYDVLLNTNVIGYKYPPFYQENTTIYDCIKNCSADDNCNALTYYTHDDACFYFNGEVTSDILVKDNSFIQPVMFIKK